MNDVCVNPSGVLGLASGVGVSVLAVVGYFYTLSELDKDNLEEESNHG